MPRQILEIVLGQPHRVRQQIGPAAVATGEVVAGALPQRQCVHLDGLRRPTRVGEQQGAGLVNGGRRFRRLFEVFIERFGGVGLTVQRQQRFGPVTLRQQEIRFEASALSNRASAAG